MKSYTTIEDKKNRLGRGLDTLLGSSKDITQVLLVNIEKIYPNKEQPRKNFNKESIKELCDSIKKQGLLQPILLQKKGDKYEIIAGERRWRATCMAGLHKIPAIIKNPDPSQKALWALIENLQREDLNPIEEARAFKNLMEKQGLKQEFLAKKLGRSRSSLANSLRLLQLDPEVQKLVEERQIGFAQARELLRFKSPKKQRDMAKECQKKSLTVRSLGVKQEKNELQKAPFWAKKSLSYFEKQKFCKVQLQYLNGKGRLSFSFQSDAELKELLNKLLNKDNFYNQKG